MDLSNWVSDIEFTKIGNGGIFRTAENYAEEIKDFWSNGGYDKVYAMQSVLFSPILFPLQCLSDRLTGKNNLAKATIYLGVSCEDLS